MTKNDLNDKKYFIYNTYGISNETAYNAIKENVEDITYARSVFSLIQDGMTITSLHRVSAISDEAYEELSLIFKKM